MSTMDKAEGLEMVDRAVKLIIEEERWGVHCEEHPLRRRGGGEGNAITGYNTHKCFGFQVFQIIVL